MHSRLIYVKACGCVILHRPAQFRPNRIKPGVVMTSYQFFSDVGGGVTNLLPVAALVTALV